MTGIPGAPQRDIAARTRGHDTCGMLRSVPFLEELDRRLQYGPGMRVQRLFEAAFLIVAFFSADTRFAWVVVASMALQALSPRLVPIALAVSWFFPPAPEHALGDLYFDLAGSRGACIASLVVQCLGLQAVSQGYGPLGWALLAVPAASFLLAPTVGFCCGCALYVISRDALARFGIVARFAEGARDVEVDREAPRPQ